MKNIRTIVESNKEPTYKEVGWLDTRNNQYKLKFWRNNGWVDIYRDLQLNPDDYITKLDASRKYQPIGNYSTINDLLTKQDTLISGINIKTINNKSILGTGDIAINEVGKFYFKNNVKGEIFNDYENNIAEGSNAHAEGSKTTARGADSHAEGQGTIAENSSHAEGRNSHSRGYVSHAEGNATQANGNYSHAEGNATISEGVYSHAEGNGGKAVGDSSHAEGIATQALGNASHAEGNTTVARNQYEHAQGSYNKSNTGDSTDKKTLHSIGFGTSDSNRKNLQEVMQNGDFYILGIGGYDGSNYEEAKTLQDVIKAKQDVLKSGENIATINGQSLLNGGNIIIQGGGGEQIIYDADNIMFKTDLTITADVGVHTIGSSGSKTLETTGKSLKQVMDMLFAEEKNPTITQPYVNITLTGAGTKEVGTMFTPNYSTTLNPGSYQYGPATGVTATSYNITDTNSNNSTTASGSFPQFQVTDTTNYKITATIQHTEGTIPLTNLENEYEEGKITAGTKSKNSSTVTGYRNSFYGTLESKEELTSSVIRGLEGKSNRALTNGSTFTVNVKANAKRTVIAYPSTLNDLTKILDFNDSNKNILNSFTKTTVEVEGANGYSATTYKVYYCDYGIDIQSDTYTVTI